MTTITAPPGFPLTLADRALAPDILRAKVSYEAYLDFAEVAPYNIEYYNGELISMSQASLPHESLVSRFSTLFNNLFDDDDEIQVFGSNIKIEVMATGDSFNADVSIVRGEPDYLRLPSGMLSTVSITNPTVLVEVLSPGTMAYDLGDKLESYKQIPALQQILFVSPDKPWVSSYLRSDTPGLWFNTSFHALTDAVTVLDQPVALAAIYKKTKFA
jgi:Uma2 family endonuclease